MENRGYCHRIQSFWHRFTETFQLVLAVLAGVVLCRIPEADKSLIVDSLTYELGSLLES